MYVPEPTNIPIEKTNRHGETDLEVPLWPTPGENDIIHLPRGKPPGSRRLWSPLWDLLLALLLLFKIAYEYVQVACLSSVQIMTPVRTVWLE